MRFRVLVAAFLIGGYRACIRPLLIGQCKFHPTCSEYGYQAVCEHGFIRGVALTFRRVVRCHPLSHGGIDPVPPVASGCRAEPTTQL